MAAQKADLERACEIIDDLKTASRMLQTMNENLLKTAKTQLKIIEHLRRSRSDILDQQLMDYELLKDAVEGLNTGNAGIDGREIYGRLVARAGKNRHSEGQHCGVAEHPRK
jgi:hypothetical protein